MRYLALESLSHLATSDLSREAVKKHQDTVLEQLKVHVYTQRQQLEEERLCVSIV